MASIIYGEPRMMHDELSGDIIDREALTGWIERLGLAGVWQEVEA